MLRKYTPHYPFSRSGPIKWHAPPDDPSSMGSLLLYGSWKIVPLDEGCPWLHEDVVGVGLISKCRVEQRRTEVQPPFKGSLVELPMDLITLQRSSGGTGNAKLPTTPEGVPCFKITQKVWRYP